MRIIRELMNMTSATYVERAAGWTRILEDKEAARSSEPLKDVRPRVARKVGVSTGTLENLRNGRLKAIAAHAYARIARAIENELASEMRRLEAELHLIRQQGVDPRDGEAQQVMADLTAVRRALGLNDGGAK